MEGKRTFSDNHGALLLASMARNNWSIEKKEDLLGILQIWALAKWERKGKYFPVRDKEQGVMKQDTRDNEWWEEKPANRCGG